MMSVKTTSDDRQRGGLSPFVLKWAEETPEGLLWSQKSVFSAPVNGLDIFQVAEPDKPETTGGGDTADTSHTGAA
jgi:hypothetical protein